MILSDTIHYRQDGTASSVQRIKRETFRKPSGTEGYEDVTSEVPLSALDAVLAPAYGGMDAQNKALEGQLASEREAAAAAIAERDLNISDLRQSLAVAEGKLKAIADVDRQYDAVVKPLLPAATS